MTDAPDIAHNEDLKRQIAEVVIRAYPGAQAIDIDVKISVRLLPAQEFVSIDIVPATAEKMAATSTRPR